MSNEPIIKGNNIKKRRCTMNRSIFKLQEEKISGMILINFITRILDMFRVQEVMSLKDERLYVNIKNVWKADLINVIMF